MNLLLSRVKVVLCFGAFEAFFVSFSKLLFHTCLLWHRQLSSLPAVDPLFRPSRHLPPLGTFARQLLVLRVRLLWLK